MKITRILKILFLLVKLLILFLCFNTFFVDSLLADELDTHSSEESKEQSLWEQYKKPILIVAGIIVAAASGAYLVYKLFFSPPSSPPPSPEPTSVPPAPTTTPPTNAIIPNEPRWLPDGSIRCQPDELLVLTAQQIVEVCQANNGQMSPAELQELLMGGGLNSFYKSDLVFLFEEIRKLQPLLARCMLLHYRIDAMAFNFHISTDAL